MNKAAMATGVGAVAGAIGNVIVRWIGAYETSKRLDLEMAQLKAKHDLTSQAFALKREQLAVAERAFNAACKALEDQLKRYDGSRKENNEVRKTWLKQADRLLEDIMRDDISEQKRDKMINLWNRTQDTLTAGLVRTDQLIMSLPAAAKLALEAPSVALGNICYPKIEG